MLGTTLSSSFKVYYKIVRRKGIIINYVLSIISRKKFTFNQKSRGWVKLSSSPSS